MTLRGKLTYLNCVSGIFNLHCKSFLTRSYAAAKTLPDHREYCPPADSNRRGAPEACPPGTGRKRRNSRQGGPALEIRSADGELHPPPPGRRHRTDKEGLPRKGQRLSSLL